jgi:putative transposase
MKDTKKGSAEQSEMGLSLEELIRRGARGLIQKAIEVEVKELLEEYGNVKMLGGQRAVVRNGYLPARDVLTAVGNVEVRVPKVRDRSGTGIKFNSALVPPFVRRSARMSAALPWLYLKGISTGDMREALTVLVGDQARGLSPNVVSRLKGEWAAEYGAWMKRDRSASRYVYWWADGIHTGLRQEDDARQCLLVIIGVTPDGRKELVTIGDGLRESKESWLDVLRDLAGRGLEAGPLLAVGDGALGFWAALDEVYPETRRQRCWVHKTGNVLNALPKSLQARGQGGSARNLDGAHASAGDRRLRPFPEDLRRQVPKGDRQTREGSRSAARLLRLSRRALDSSAHDQSDRIDIRNRPPPHDAHEELRLTQYLSRTGVQARPGSREVVAPHSRDRTPRRTARRNCLQRRRSHTHQ